MSKRCARCEKTVYPIEELKCLDKIWHKGCFKCQECGMTLSMKTYKGFNKLPYCEAHIPKAKATAVAETPEMKRLAENTKIQSNVQYHADFEKNKAKFTQVADDPETRRIKQNTKIISNVSYHGELEKKAQMERRRSEPNTEEELQRDGVPAAAPSHDGYYERETSVPNPPIQQSHSIPHSQPISQSHTVQSNQQLPYRGPVAQPYSGMPASNHSNPQPYYQQQHHQHHTTPSTNHMYEQQQQQQQQHQQQHQPPPQSSAYYHKGPGVNNSNATTPYHHHHRHPHPNVAQQNAYQDANHNSPYSARNSQTLIYSSQTGPVQQTTSARIGSIADYDPLNDQYGSIAQKKAHQQPGGYRQQETYQGQRSHVYAEGNQHYPQNVHGNQMTRQNQMAQQQKVNAPPTQLGRCYRAIYDYEAADDDEVSFRYGDLLTNCTSIDEGWMMGTVQRTGRMGMLPANYVERAA